MKVLIDTNVVLDHISEREPYVNDAHKIMNLCGTKRIEGSIAAHTITNLFYILRKDLSIEDRKATLLKLCRVFTVVGVDIMKLIAVLENGNFSDLEDCLQDECANEFRADFLITRNLNDFKHGKVKAIKPSDFLSLINA